MTDIKERWRRVGTTALAVGLSVSTLARATAADWVDFSPPGGGHLPVRFYQGQVECASTDGHDCEWGVSAAEVLSNASNLQPLRCGANHKAQWGTDGYSAAGHWCSAAYSQLYATWAAASRAGSTVYYSVTPVSVSTTGEVVGGDVQCLSKDHHNCMWNETDMSRLKATTLSLAQPLVCGAMHNDEWGGTGYGSPSHWCSVISAQYQTPTTVPYVNPADCYSFSGQDPDWWLTVTESCASVNVPLLTEVQLGSLAHINIPSGIAPGTSIRLGTSAGQVAVTGTGFMFPAPVPYPLLADDTGAVGNFYIDTSTGTPTVFQQVQARTPGDGSTLPTADEGDNYWFQLVGSCLQSSCASVEARPNVAPPQVVTAALNAGFLIGPATVTRGQSTALTVFLNRSDLSNNVVTIALALPPGVTAPTDRPTSRCTGTTGTTDTTGTIDATWKAASPQPTVDLTLPNLSQCTLSLMLNVAAAAQTGGPLVTMTATTTDGTRSFTLPIYIR